MFRGVDTQKVYEQFLKKGFCKDHATEFYQKDNAEEYNQELSRKAMLFIRVGILDPIFFQKPAKCEKIKFLIKKTSCFSYNFTENDVPDEAYDNILVLDSVVVFTLCHLSKICCIGSLFQSSLRTQFEDAEKCFLQNLLHTERLTEADISHLNPLLQQNFAGENIDLIKVCYAAALLFVRNVCINLNIKSALQTVEKEMFCFSEEDVVDYMIIAGNSRRIHDYDHAMETYNLGLKNLPYSDELYHGRGIVNVDLQRLKAALMDFYISLMIKPACVLFMRICLLFNKLNRRKDVIEIAEFALRACKTKGCKDCMYVEYCKDDKVQLLSDILMKKEFCNGLSKQFASVKLPETDNSFPELVEDSDSTESESESGPVLVDASDSESTDTEMDSESIDARLVSESVDARLISESVDDKLITESIDAKLIAESTGSTIVSESTDAKVISESTDTRLKTKPEVNTPTRAKKQNANKQKRMSDKPSSQVEEKECLDITAINSYLKEASEALLEDCGYKALKIFHESLRPVIESPETYSSDPSEIICLKYSYGLAYYQSGEYDDLQKCITIFREIIEKPDWITFPPAYYVLGLAYRKLNRFKEALVYLENVQSILDRGINTKVYTWPGLKTVINETRSKILKGLVNELIKDCENPPNPNAICRFPECQFKSIYYTDPDFKGYMSISCSEQCSLQYHVQCWKLIKTEKKLTDKELLEQQCLTPDCEGVIVKVQSIDKKGDISKEFLSDVKKVPKQKWAKWDKKVETKEKDKKKKRAHSSRSESREHSIESEKVLSRKNSNVTEASLPSLESSAPDSNQEENLPINPQNEQHKFLENFEISSSTSVSSEPVKEFPIINSTVPESPQSQNISEIHDVQPFENNSEYVASNCMRNNIYSYMADFLQCHGPLKIDDPILISEMATFPEDIRSVIEDCGGIGEFLKNDLRFAYVGDSYVCVVSDLGSAYAMHSSSSLPTGVDCLNSVEDSDFSKIRLFYNNEPYELNPDATEYKPAATSETMKNTNFKITRDSNSDISSNYNFVTKTYELFPAPENNADNVQSFNDLYSSKIFDKKTDDNFNNSKPISLQVLSSEEIVPSNSKARKKLFEEFKPNLDTSISDLKKLSESNYNLKSEVIQTFQSVGENLLLLLNLFFSEGMEPHRQTLSSFIEPYAIKKNDNTTHTENNEDQISPSTPEYYAVLDEVKSVAHTLNIENDILNEQKNLLQDQLILAEQQKQSFASEVLNLKKKLQDQLVLAEQQKQEFISENSKLKKRLEDSAAQLETLKVEYSEKEKHLESGRKYLLESLTHAHETIAKQRKEIDLWKIEKNSILKTIEDLKVSLDVADEKLKKNIEETERNQAAIRNKLQSENTTLKARVLYADRQLLSFKKTEYLKRIDEKILQASQRRKELTDGLSMMCGNLNPVLETSMKSLAAELSTYESKLAAAKFSFSMKIDEQIKKIENGATLLNMEEIKMENIPDIPCWKNLLPSNSSNFDKLMNGSNQMPFNLGWNSGTLPGLTAAAIIPPATAIIPPAATVTPSLATASSPLVTVPPPVSAVNPPINSAVISKTPGKSSNFENSKKGIIEKKSEPLDILNLNPDIQESYKSAMASINSFASTPLANSVPSLEDDLDKHFLNFKQPLTPAVSNSTVDTPKVPPGIRQPLLPTPPRQTLLPTPIQKSVYASSSVHSSNTSLDAMSFGGPDPVPKTTSEHEKKTVSAGKNNYEKLLFRLKEQYPSYSQEELMSFVKEFRMQRQGKLSGLPIDTIISRIGEIIKTKKNLGKKAVDSKIQIKPNKVLINKKLVPDPKPKDPPPPSGARKKCPWNVESDSQKTWTASDVCECVICYNEMEEGNSYKVQCGHVFHEECIRQWLNEKSDCPICRVHLLLPEDFPSLT